MLGKMSGVNERRKKRTMKVKEAKEILSREIADELIDEEEIVREAISPHRKYRYSFS